MATKTDDAKSIAMFFYENIITRFGCPKELVRDCGTQFLMILLNSLLINF